MSWTQIILSNFKLYRKWKGGTWYYVRYIQDFGRTVIFMWMPFAPQLPGGYILEKEEY